MRKWFITIWAWFRDHAYYLVTAFAIIKIAGGYLAHWSGFWVDPTIRHSLAGLPQPNASILVLLFQFCLLVLVVTKIYRSPNLKNRWSVPAIAGWIGLAGVVFLSGWIIIVALIIFLAGVLYHWHKT